MPQALAPITGQVVAPSHVPDPVFSQQMMGPGIAIQPTEEQSTALAPITGQVLKCFPHAFVIEHETTLAVLVHLGLDTINLGGQGFDVCVSEGQRVQAGDAMVRWSPAGVRAAGYDPICPVIALEIAPEMLDVLPEPGAEIRAGEPLFTWA